MEKFRFKTLSIALAIMVAVSMVAASSVVRAEETKASLDKKIDKAQEKIEENNKKKENISAEIDEIEGKINKGEKELNKLSDDVTDAHMKLVEQKKELSKGKKGLNERLRNIYKGGSMGFIDIIFSSGSVSDLFSNLEMVKYIFKNDKEVVGHLKEEYKEIEKLEANLKTKENALEAKQDELSADKSILAKQSDKLTAQNKELNEDIDQWEKDSAAIQSKIEEVYNSGSGYQGPTTSSSGFMWPVAGSSNETSQYGYRVNPVTGEYKLHAGLDIGAAYGTPVVASKSGKVILSSWYFGLGNCVIIDHGNGVTTTYGHNSSLVVSAGQEVKQGQTIARIGSTGNSTGNHCHFEIRINGTPQNPKAYL